MVRKNNEMVARFKELRVDYIKEGSEVKKPPENQRQFKERCKNLVESAMGTYIEVEQDKTALTHKVVKKKKRDPKVEALQLAQL